MSKSLPTLAIIGTKGFPYVYSGYETFVYELARRLRDRYEIHVYCHRGLFAQRPPLVDGIHLHYLPALETRWLSTFSHGLLSFGHALFRRYDLHLFVNCINAPFGALMHHLGYRTVLNTDGLEWMRPQMRGLPALLMKGCATIAARSGQPLVTDCEAMSAVYRREWSADSHTIAYGADLSISTESVKLADFGVRPREYYLIAGRLIPDNNAEMLIRGFQASQSTKRLLIVGDALYPDAYSKEIRKLADERVSFTGFVRDRAQLRALFHNSFAYLHGHEFGGTNPTLLEGLASGSCILALDTAFNREVLDGPRFGIYFDKTAEAVAKQIRLLENDPALVQSLRARSEQRIREHYTWEKIVDQYDALFQSMLLRHPAAVSSKVA